MAIVSSRILTTVNKPNGRKIMMQATDHVGAIYERRPNVPADNDDAATLAAWVVELDLTLPDLEAEAEVLRAQSGQQQDAQHQTQAELDRKTINLMMQIEDSLEFSRTLQWFRDFEVRGGTNNNARAGYLGMTTGDYSEVADRYNQITGVKSGLEADANRVWDEVER